MNEFGKELVFHTNVRTQLCDDWKLYALYFSLKCWLPESSLTISVLQGKDICLHWTNRPDIKVVGSQPTGSISLPLTVVAIASSGEIGPIKAKSKSHGLFADYSDGVGSFTDLDTDDPPLWEAVKRFGVTASYANEVAVLDIWRRAAISYRML